MQNTPARDHTTMTFHHLLHTKDRLSLWLQWLQEVRPRRAAEVGVWKGDFAATVLHECTFIEEYVMIDPWVHLPDWNKPFNVSPQEFSRVHEEAMNKTRFAADRIRVLRGRTKDVVRHIEDDSLDFVYIDGEHTLKGITIDLITLFPKIKAGGFLAGDDFTNVSWQHSSDFEPTLVCPFAVYFAEAVDCPVFALPHNQFLVIKDLNSDFLFTDTTGNYSDLSVNRPPHQSRGLENMLKRRLSRLWKQKRGSQRTH